MLTTHADNCLKRHRETWQNKPTLRKIYHNYYKMIKNECTEGVILEIGGGCGNFKDYFPNAISSDFVALPWLDIISDAQMLPFRTESIANIVMVDVLHHLEDPLCFLKEAERVLKPKGRLVILEPAITPISWIFLTLFHPEPINMRQNPFEKSLPDPEREPFDANQAIPTLLFGQYRSRLFKLFPQFNLVEFNYLDLIAYPLSGGFRSWCLIPNSIIKPLLSIEYRLLPFLGPLMAFRFLCVIEKTSAASS